MEGIIVAVVFLVLAYFVVKFAVKSALNESEVIKEEVKKGVALYFAEKNGPKLDE